MQLNLLPRASTSGLDERDVRELETITRAPRLFQAGVAALLVALVLGLSYFSASDAAHNRLHTDADHANHQCVITLFAGGQVLSVTPETTVAVVALVFCFLVGISLSSIRLNVRHRLPFGCGPPA